MDKKISEVVGGDAEKAIVGTVELSAPILVHGEETRFLEFREPTGKDIMACGAAFTIGIDESVRIDYKAVGAYAVRLAGVPKNSVEQLSGKDLNACAQMVMGFFQ